MGKYSPLSFHRASTICPHLLWLSAKASKVNNGTLNAQQPRSDVFLCAKAAGTCAAQPVDLCSQSPKEDQLKFLFSFYSLL